MELAFSGPVFEWRGPAPYHFVRVPEDESAEIQSVVRAVTYGWGMVPVTVRVGATTFETSLWPREGGYVLPLKDKVRAAEQIALGDTVDVRMTLAPPR